MVRPVTIRPVYKQYIAAMCPTFSFKCSDLRLGVEVQPMGEVACSGKPMYELFLKAFIAAGCKLPSRRSFT